MVGQEGGSMKYHDLRNRLIHLFEEEKLQALPEEWGFYNEIEREIKTVGYATNLTEEIIQKAGERKAEVLLTHHDSWMFIYGLKEGCNQMLKENHITHAFFHAPLDDAHFGTSASLAQALGMKNCKKVMPYEKNCYGGVAGDLIPVDFHTIKEKLTEILREEVRCFQNHKKLIQRVAVAAGGGNMTNEMRIAAEDGCDTYITGEYALYSQQYAKHTGMNLFVGSHTNTEILGVERMAALLGKDTDLQIVRIEEPNY